MDKLKHFISQSFIGGVLVIAPIVILLLALRWAMHSVQALIAPLTDPLERITGAPSLVIDVAVIALILIACFMVGTLVATRAGLWIQNFVDAHLARFAPGYKLIRDIIQQMFGTNSNSPFTRGEAAVTSNRYYHQSSQQWLVYRVRPHRPQPHIGFCLPPATRLCRTTPRH